jgi:hypothetical protein
LTRAECNQRTHNNEAAHDVTLASNSHRIQIHPFSGGSPERLSSDIRCIGRLEVSLWAPLPQLDEMAADPVAFYMIDNRFDSLNKGNKKVFPAR